MREEEIIVLVQIINLRSGWDNHQVAKKKKRKKKVIIERKGIWDSVSKLDLRHEEISSQFQPTVSLLGLC